MLLFAADDVELLEDRQPCHVCQSRKASWKACVQTRPVDDLIIRKDDKVPVCGWCILYSAESKWGQEHKDEILHVGRAAQEMAAKSKKPIPALDERGRLTPPDAERFVLGVAFTSREIKRISRLGRMAGE